MARTVEMNDEQYKRYLESELSALESKGGNQGDKWADGAYTPKDFTPVKGTDGRTYPAYIYQDKDGKSRNSMTFCMKQDAEKNYRRLHPSQQW